MRMVFEDGERNALIKQLGLEDKADDTALSTAVADRLKAAAAPPPPEKKTDPDDLKDLGSDVVVIDVAEFQRLRGRDNQADEVEKAMEARDRTELIESAIADGKFGPGRREYYTERYKQDPEGTKALIGRLLNGSIPLKERGKNAPTDQVADDAYPTEWAPEVAARQSGQQQQQTGQQQPSRVHGEV